MILVCYILSILCGASGDAFDYTGKKTAGHILQGCEIFTWLTLFILALVARPDYDPDQIVIIALSYFALRFFLFDYIWNICAGQKLFYIGNTSIYDKILQVFHPAIIHLMKFSLGILAIIFLSL